MWKLKRDAAVVHANVDTERDVDMLPRALSDEEPLVREHAARAPGRPAWRRARA